MMLEGGFFLLRRICTFLHTFRLEIGMSEYPAGACACALGSNVSEKYFTDTILEGDYH
jgi:sialic acid synthase SpsE